MGMAVAILGHTMAFQHAHEFIPPVIQVGVHAVVRSSQGVMAEDQGDACVAMGCKFTTDEAEF